MPGWSAVVLRQDADEPAEIGEPGRIAVALKESPLAWFSGYQGEGAASGTKLSQDGRFYMTGDAGSVDDEGYFHFAARDDDVIIMAGYRIGPFEVESVLVSHPAVLEAAVIGAPDDTRGEVLEAFVVVTPGVVPDAELASELQLLVKREFAAHAFPRRVHFIDALPKTPSGKIQRFVLRQRRRA